LTIDFKVITKNNIQVCRILKASRKIIIDTNTIIELSIYLLQFSLDKNYLFKSKLIDILISIIWQNIKSKIAIKLISRNIYKQ